LHRIEDLATGLTDSYGVCRADGLWVTKGASGDIDVGRVDRRKEKPHNVGEWG
jgi:hypothetical protein